MQITSLIPMLETQSVSESVKFYTQVLDFSCRNIMSDEGIPYWAMVQKDNAFVMFCSRDEHTKVEKPTMTGVLYFYPEDIDKAWEELKDKVSVEYPIYDFEYGMREFAIRDNNGYILKFGQEIQ